MHAKKKNTKRISIRSHTCTRRPKGPYFFRDIWQIINYAFIFSFHLNRLFMRSFFHSFVVYTLKRYVCNSYKFGDAMPMPRKSRETTVNWESAAFAAATSKSGLLPCRWIMASALVKFEFIVEDNLISRSVCASVRIWMISLGERNIYIFFHLCNLHAILIWGYV
jgi:hypothetical protein